MDEFSFCHKPLDGKTILIIRTGEQASPLASRLETLGARCMEAPVFEIMFPDSFAELDQAIQAMHLYQWLLFTSANGVDAFFRRFKAAGMDTGSLHLQMAAVGLAAAERLKTYNAKADVVSFAFNAEGVIASLSGYIEQGMDVLIPKAMQEQDIVSEKFKHIGIRATQVPAYKRVIDEVNSKTIVARFLSKEIDAVAFTCESAVSRLPEIFGHQAAGLVTKAKVVCIGPVTAAACLENGIKPDGIAEEYTMHGLVEALVKIIGKKPSR